MWANQTIISVIFFVVCNSLFYTFYVFFIYFFLILCLEGAALEGNSGDPSSASIADFPGCNGSTAPQSGHWTVTQWRSVSIRA